MRRASSSVDHLTADRYRALPAPSASDALRLCVYNQPDLMVLDPPVEEGREDQDGKHVLNENVLIEIGAAFVLYDTRVVLVWDKRLEVRRISQASTAASSRVTS